MRAAVTRDRAIILLALLAATAVAWVYLVVAQQHMAAPGMGDVAGMAATSGPMPGMAMTRSTSGAAMSSGMAGMAAAPGGMAWSTSTAALTFAMWWIMMLGMMLPSAAPMLLTYATIARRQRERAQPFVPVAVFAFGYLLAWGAFSIAATLLQWALDRGALLSPMVRTTGVAAGGALFVLAGLYQFTALKHACLRHCRSPFAFLLAHWRDGWRGALGMGWRHGLYCLGCCWVLMLLLFAVGVMNLAWVAVLALFVLAEKLLPQGVWIARGAGVALLGFGGYLLATGTM